MVGVGLKYATVNEKRKRESAEQKARWIKLFRSDPQARVADVCEELGMSVKTYRVWRQKDPQFAGEVSMLRARAGRVLHPAEKDIVPQPFQGDFVAKRLHYFGFETPWFQKHTVDAYRAAKPGDIVLTLMPPEHGKTTLTEDDLTISIAEDPNQLITCISEGQDMARKISRRLMKRLSDDGTAIELVHELGPFQPQGGESSARQPWGVDAWSVYKSGLLDARDYTFATGGWKSAIAGTRATRLHVDDIQSKRSLNQTEDMWELFRQDMLSRPGERGITTANGTRVGPRDFWGRMDDEFHMEEFYTKIEFPAIVLDSITQEPKPLWEYDEHTGAGYTMEQLDRLRKKVGEEAWWRNYMQKPRSNELEVFSEEGIKKCENTFRSYHHTKDQLPDIANDECWIGVDPSIGGINVTCAVHPESDRLIVLDLQEDVGLPRNSAIAEVVDQMIQRLNARGWRTTMLVIEAMAFQKGLIEDEAFKDLEKRHGLRVESHLTGYNKYDENVGIPSMASSVESGKIDLAYQSDRDRHISDGLTAQFRAWKPTRDKTTGRLKFQRGTQLRQDQLMALWFTWIWWTEMVAGSRIDTDPSKAFSMNGLPFAPTQAGLLVPR